MCWPYAGAGAANFQRALGEPVGPPHKRPDADVSLRREGDPFQEVAALVLGIEVDVFAGQDWAGSDSDGLQPVHQIVLLEISGPGADNLVQGVVVA